MYEKRYESLYISTYVDYFVTGKDGLEVICNKEEESENGELKGMKGRLIEEANMLMTEVEDLQREVINELREVREMRRWEFGDMYID